MGFERISVEKARDLIANDNARVIDVRDPVSYEAGHIKNADQIDDSKVEEFVREADLARPLIVCCYHGNMSQGAAEYFASQGFEQAYSIDGGYAAWEESDPE